MDDQLQEARTLAALAGIRVPPNRVGALAGGLALTKRIAESLATTDFGVAAPAAQFRAPEAHTP